MSYPPEPWRLHAHGCVALWLVRTTALPPLPVRPVTLFGRAVVSTAFVAYRPPGLAYHEVLAAVLVREGRRFGVSITDIRVDSPVSRAGGRELWGIPKELAEFEWDGLTASARDERGPIASVRARPPRFGAWLPAAAATWQALGDGLARTPLRGWGRVTPVRATWRVDPAGPLAWLHPHRPVVSVAVHRMRLRFGPCRRP